MTTDPLHSSAPIARSFEERHSTTLSLPLLEAEHPECPLCVVPYGELNDNKESENPCQINCNDCHHIFETGFFWPQTDTSLPLTNADIDRYIQHLVPSSANDT
jgi:hypothetical protein